MDAVGHAPCEALSVVTSSSVLSDASGVGVRTLHALASQDGSGCLRSFVGLPTGNSWHRTTIRLSVGRSVIMCDADRKTNRSTSYSSSPTAAAAAAAAGAWSC